MLPGVIDPGLPARAKARVDLPVGHRVLLGVDLGLRQPPRAQPSERLPEKVRAEAAPLVAGEHTNSCEQLLIRPVGLRDARHGNGDIILLNEKVGGVGLADGFLDAFRHPLRDRRQLRSPGRVGRVRRKNDVSQ